MNDHNNHIALVIGLCSHGLAMTRALTKCGVEVHALEANIDLPGALTSSAKVHKVESIKQESIIDDLISFREKFSVDTKIVLLPTNDNNVKIIAANIALLSPHYIISWDHCADTVAALLLKSNIEQRCEQADLLYPKSMVMSDTNDVDKATALFEFPVIIKPVNPQSSFKALRCDTPEQLHQLVEQYKQDLPILVQHWISGGDTDLFFCALYLDKGKVVTHYLGNKLASFPPAMGQTTVAVSCNETDLIELTERFFDGLEMSGPVSVEFKKDQQGRYWIIEPTIGRTDFWVGLCIRSGCNLPYIEYQTCLNLPILTEPIQSAIWFDSERDVTAFFKHVTRCKIPAGGKNITTFSYLDNTDLKPFYRAMGQARKRLLAKFRPKTQRYIGKSQSLVSGNVIEYCSLAELPEDCITLLRKSGEDNFFLGEDWYRNFCQHVANQEELVRFYCLFDSDGNAHAVLPAWIQIRKIFGFHHRAITSLTNYYSPIFDLCIDETLIDKSSAYLAFLNYFNQQKKQWDIIDFSPIAPEIKQIIANEAKRTSLPCFSYFKTLNLFEPSIASFDAYIDGRDAKIKNTLKRKENKLTRKFDWSIDILSTPDDISASMVEYHRVYNASWKEQEPYPDFINGMAEVAANKDRLRLGLLKVNGKAIATQLWIVANNTAYIYKLAYDSDYRDYSPGTVLTKRMFEYVLNNDKITKVDFLTGDDAYKSDWMSSRRALYGVQMISFRRFRGVLIYVVDYLSKLRQKLKKIF